MFNVVYYGIILQKNRKRHGRRSNLSKQPWRTKDIATVPAPRELIAQELCSGVKNTVTRRKILNMIRFLIQQSMELHLHCDKKKDQF